MNFNIKNILLICSILLVSINNINAQDWTSFRSFEGRFKVKTLGNLKETISKVETQIGEMEYHTFTYQDTNEEALNVFYIISYVDYPEGSIHSDSSELVKEFLDATVEESVLSINGVLKYQSDIYVDDYLAKQWRVDYGENEEGVIRTRAFVVKNRFYTIQTVCTKLNSMNTDSDDFMESFELLDINALPIIEEPQPQGIPLKKWKRKNKKK